MLSKFNDDQIDTIREMDGNNCPNCFRSVAIDTYGITPTIVDMLRKMIENSTKDNDFVVDIKKIGFTHTMHSQISKLRYHGFVRKAKGPEGKQIPNCWIVNPKGYNFDKGELVDAKVDVYNNSLLGHHGGQTTVGDVLKADKHGADETVLERTFLSPEQGRVLNKAREGVKNMEYRAKFIGRDHTGRFNTGTVYDLVVERLQIGKPVYISKPFEQTYSDIARFNKNWSIEK